MLRKLEVLSLPPIKCLFQKIDKDQNSRSLKIVNLFFSRFYLKAVDLFHEFSGSRDMDSLMPASQAFYFLEDLFRDELIVKDDGQELFELKSQEKVKIYMDVYMFDFLKLDKSHYDNYALREPSLSLDQVINF